MKHLFAISVIITIGVVSSLISHFFKIDHNRCLLGSLIGLCVLIYEKVR